jgi:hypothetical protein
MHKMRAQLIQSWVIKDEDTLLNIPPHVQEISLGPFFNQSIPKNLIPRSTTYINMGSLYNKSIECKVLPSKLKILFMSSEFNQPLISGSLPADLEELYFGNYYDQAILENDLPQNLKKIVFGFRFNQKLSKSNLPKKLEYLELGYNQYNQKITYLSPTIKHFKIKVLPRDKNFPSLHGLDVIDPSTNLTGLIDLEYWSCANINIEQLSLLTHLKILDLDCDISSLTKLETLHIVDRYEQKYINSLPDNIQKIIFTQISLPVLNIPPNTKLIQIYKFEKKELVFQLKIPFGANLINYSGDLIEL